MDQPAFWESSTFAAAKLAMALWSAQLSLSALDRRRATLGWHIFLAAAATCASLWALPAPNVPVWWRPGWLIGAIVSAAALIDCVRRWVSVPSGELETWRVHDVLSWTGFAVSALAASAAVVMQLPPGWISRSAAALYSLSCAGLLGLVMAFTLELTLGARGTALLHLRWKLLARWTSLCWAVQLVLSVYIILSQRAAETPLETAAPFLFAFGMMIVGYIAWCIPRRMVALSASGAMQGHVSLAISAWLAAICLAIACALPATWPWRELSQPSAGALPLAIIEK